MYGCEGQAEVYRSQLKMIRRKKGKSLTDLAMEIRKLMVMDFLGSQDSTTEVIARDVFLDALKDAELVIQIQAQRSRDLESALQTAQHMEAVMKSATIKNGRPVRVVVQTADPVTVAPESCGKLKNELRDQRVLLDAVSGSAGVAGCGKTT